MTTSRFLIVAALGLSAAAACLALAAVLDIPALAVTGAALVILVFVAREGWMWRGRRRQWAVMIGGLVAVILVAFIAAKLLGE